MKNTRKIKSSISIPVHYGDKMIVFVTFLKTINGEIPYGIKKWAF